MLVPLFRSSVTSAEPLPRAGRETLPSRLESGSAGSRVANITVASREGPSSDVFAELYRAHFAYVWKSARRLGVGHAEADDVVQETFLTVHRLLPTLEPDRAVRSWLFAILYRIVLRHRRSYRRRTALTDDDINVEAIAESAARSPDKGVETSETVRMLESIFDRLDADKRAVLILAEVEEKPITEIAEILGININTASSRLRVAREYVEASFARLAARDAWRLK